MKNDLEIQRILNISEIGLMTTLGLQLLGKKSGISPEKDWLRSGAYTGFYKGWCERGALEIFFSHPGAKLLRIHPPFRIPPFLDQLQKFFSHPGAKLLRTHPFLHPLPGG